MHILRYLFTFLICLTLTLVCIEGAYADEKPAESMPFAVYTESTARNNHFVPSGWMGDYGAIKVENSCQEKPHTGRTCIKITYSSEPTQGAGWVGLYWQNPENNWGDKDGGFNLSSAKKLTLWARGEKGSEKMEFKVGGITGSYPDSDMIGIGPLEITNDWKQYAIDLEMLDLSYMSGGFVWAASRMDNPDGAVVYLDDIIYE